jgi:hypothetical protein
MTPIGPRARGGRRVRWPAVALATTVAGGILLTGCGGGADALDRRRTEVAERGAEVMPFDLDATAHTFAPTDTGLVQTVSADDPSDVDQVALIRSHLAEEAARFAEGDFDDPAAIHGHTMPGLEELRAGADRIDIAYTELPDGARVTFATEDPALVEALHRWAEAQLTDHGDHARHPDP